MVWQGYSQVNRTPSARLITPLSAQMSQRRHQELLTKSAQRSEAGRNAAKRWDESRRYERIVDGILRASAALHPAEARMDFSQWLLARIAHRVS